MKARSINAALLLGATFHAAQVIADGPSAEELARKAQDPLADVRAIMTDNTIAFGTADDETSYGFQIQPVYSISTNKGYNSITSAVIPIVGAPAGAGLPQLGPEPLLRHRADILSLRFGLPSAISGPVMRSVEENPNRTLSRRKEYA